mgnify:CR=1 FL=1
MAALMLAALLAASPHVVLDAGHGGEKTGAKNAAGVYEKTITLAVAKQAKKTLEAAGFVVTMTRGDDTHVKLPDRVAMANAVGADVFVSIHANWAATPTRSGAETYILSPDASDGDAASLMHLENEEDEKLPAAAEQKSDLDLILGDLARMTAHKDSAALAKHLQTRVANVGGLGPNRGLRQAPFLVLRGADMPAALVELGYLSHARQGDVLATSSAQKAAGDAVANAIKAFLEGKK